MRKHRSDTEKTLPEHPDEQDLLDIFEDALLDIREEVRDSYIFSPDNYTVFIHHISDILTDISKYLPD